MALTMEMMEMEDPIMITMVTMIVVKMIVLMPMLIVYQVNRSLLQQSDQVLHILRQMRLLLGFQLQLLFQQLSEGCC